jgi:hypothetical protein
LARNRNKAPKITPMIKACQPLTGKTRTERKVNTPVINDVREINNENNVKKVTRNGFFCEVK